MKNNIALIGFMGTGKSAVGQALAKKLGWKFVEVDSVIEKLACKSIPDIFRENGEIAFRELEIEAIKQIATDKKQVIACGGGVVLNTINIARLKNTGVLILLTASPSVILKRTSSNPGARPMLNGEDMLTRIQDLLKFRKPFYDRATEIKISSSRTSIGAIVDIIIDRVRNVDDFEGI